MLKDDDVEITEPITLADWIVGAVLGTLLVIMLLPAHWVAQPYVVITVTLCVILLCVVVWSLFFSKKARQ